MGPLERERSERGYIVDGLRKTLGTGVYVGRREELQPPVDLGDCPTCGGWGRFGDDIECGACRGTGDRPKEDADGAIAPYPLCDIDLR